MLAYCKSLERVVGNKFMRWLIVLSDLIIPLTFAFILMYGISRKIPVYDTFIEGAQDGFKTVLHILPTIIGLMVAVGIVNIG